MPLMRVETKRKSGETNREMVARLRILAEPEKVRVENNATREGFFVSFDSPSFDEDNCVLLCKYKKYPQNT